MLLLTEVIGYAAFTEEDAYKILEVHEAVQYWKCQGYILEGATVEVDLLESLVIESLTCVKRCIPFEGKCQFVLVDYLSLLSDVSRVIEGKIQEDSSYIVVY